MRYLPKPPWPVWVGNGSEDAATYDAPGKAYDGAPRIVPAEDGEQLVGLEPGKARMGAEKHNWLFSRWSGLVEPLVHAVLRSFRGFTFQESITSAGDAGIGGYITIEDGSATSYDGLCPLYTERFQKPMLLAFGNETGSGMQRRYSSDGHHWHSAADVPLADGAMSAESWKGQNPEDPARGYTIHASSGDRSIYVMSPAVGSLTPTEIADVAPATFGFGCVRQAASGFLLGVAGGGTTTSRIFTSYPDAPSDGTYTARTVPADWNTTTIHNFAATGDAGDDGDAEVIIATGERDEMLVSDDSGQNWVSVSMPFGRVGWSAYQIAYSPVHKVFMAINSDFRVMISDDGHGWSVVQSVDLDGFITSVVDRGRLLTAAGPCFALACDRNAFGGSLARRGIMYTFDLGLNWHFVDFGISRAAGDVTLGEMLGIREWGGGLVGWAAGQGWVCPSFAVPDAETLVPG